MFVCFHLGFILHPHVHPCLYASFLDSKSHNFIITTGCVSHRLWPVLLQSFVFMSFLHDIQTSSCLKPPDPFMLCFCHCKQNPNDSGGGVQFGPQIFLMGSLQENKQDFLFTEGVYFFCAPKVMRNLLGQGQTHFRGFSACEAREKELQYIIRTAKVA